VARKVIETKETGRLSGELPPREIVAKLDEYIIGQESAKKALAVAMRDRKRRLVLEPDMIDEVHPRNVLMIGPTGVGKTELSRRIAALSNSPFVKVEASKFTEVGYVGRDVDSMITSLCDVSIELIRSEKSGQVEKRAHENAEKRLLELLFPRKKSQKKTALRSAEEGGPERANAPAKPESHLRELREGKLDNREVEVEVQERIYSAYDTVPIDIEDEADFQFKDLLGGIIGSRTVKRQMRVDEALRYLVSEEEANLLDMDEIVQQGLDNAELSGIIFIDEIDKIAGRESGHGPDVSREGVQRDILPLLEGGTVNTRYGAVRTDHILFLAAGAFHVSKPSDLIPELQGRFPVRVTLDSLEEKDLRIILEQPKNSLVKQYKALMEVEDIKLDFTPGAIEKIAHYAWVVNQTTENIGARRLITVMEKLLEELSFSAPERKGEEVLIDTDYVISRLSGLVKDENISKYIL
jgi:ATP-dependent HslUV protease ATP-binding subunit HslU